MKQLTWENSTEIATCKQTLPALQPKQPVRVQEKPISVFPILIQDGDAKIGTKINIKV